MKPLAMSIRLLEGGWYSRLNNEERVESLNLKIQFLRFVLTRYKEKKVDLVLKTLEGDKHCTP